MSENAAKKFPANISAVISGATREELAVALYLCAKKEYSVKESAKELGVSEEAFRAAVSFWRGAGMVFGTESAPALAPEKRDQRYDAVTVASSIEKDQGFRTACESLQALYGKMFTRFDYDSLLYLYDHCGLTAEYMCTLASYCVSRGKTALKYFTKTCQGLVSEGVDTYEKLEAHLEKRNRANERVYKLRRLCGMGDRAFTAKEEQYIGDWFIEKDLPFELIQHAYDIMINSIGEVKLSYMNKILARWHKDGLNSVQEVEKAESEKKEKQDIAGTGKSFDDDEFFAAAVARTKKKRSESK